MADPKYAAIYPSLKGEPWSEMDDARLWDDRKAGCTVFTMAQRARRSEDEVEARLKWLDAQAGKK